MSTKNTATRRAANSKGGKTLSTRDKRTRKRYLCDYIQKHRELTPAYKAVGRLLVNWYNEKMGHCYASIEALANELGLSRKTVKRAVGTLDSLGIVPRDIGGGWDQGKLRWNTNKYYPAFDLVLDSDTGRPRKNLPPSLSTLPPEPIVSKGRGGQNVPGVKMSPPKTPESQGDYGEGGSKCPPNKHSDSTGGANAASASPDGSPASATAPDGKKSGKIEMPLDGGIVEPAPISVMTFLSQTLAEWNAILSPNDPDRALASQYVNNEVSDNMRERIEKRFREQFEREGMPKTHLDLLKNLAPNAIRFRHRGSRGTKDQRIEREDSSAADSGGHRLDTELAIYSLK